MRYLRRCAGVKPLSVATPNKESNYDIATELEIDLNKVFKLPD